MNFSTWEGNVEINRKKTINNQNIHNFNFKAVLCKSIEFLTIKSHLQHIIIIIRISQQQLLMFQRKIKTKSFQDLVIAELINFKYKDWHGAASTGATQTQR